MKLRDRIEICLILCICVFTAILLAGCDERKEILCSNDGKVLVKAPLGQLREPYLKQTCSINEDGTITLRKQK